MSCTMLTFNLYMSRGSASLLVWSIQMCFNTTPNRKDISNDLREATAAAHQSGEVVSGTIWSPLVIYEWKTFKKAAKLPTQFI